MIHKHGVRFTDATVALAIDGQLSGLNAYVGIAAGRER
jgi:hypothetical protein